MLSIDVIVVNWNGAALLDRCIENLVSLRRRSKLPLTITVIDNASSDSSREVLGRHAADVDRLALLETNVGFAGGCNIGIRTSRAEAVLLLNSDAYPDELAIRGLAECLSQDPSAGVVGPQLVYEDGRWQRSSGRRLSIGSVLLDAIGITACQEWVWARAHAGGRLRRRLKEVGYLPFACVLMRREAIDEVGLLNERFFFYMEDVEYCERLSRAGWRVLLMLAVDVPHVHGGSSSKVNLPRTIEQRVLAEKQFSQAKQGGREQWQKIRKIRWLGFACRALVGKYVASTRNCASWEANARYYRGAS
ncbi:MAG: glycosyltransferase family 2 protein [Thermoanaerobaculia bacterium]